MGLDIITGTMGGGKSIFAVERAIECWKAGGWVHSNLPFIDEELEREGWIERHVKLPKNTELWARKEKQDDGSEILVSDIIIGGAEGAENLVIIDEAALQFHAYDQVENRRKNRAMFEFVVMSRQIGIDIYFISQSATNIDAAIRKVAQSVIKCVNVRNIPGVGPIIAPFVGNFRRLWLSPDKGAVLSASFARFRPDAARIYKTHGEGDKIGIKRDASRKVQRARLSPVVWLFMFLILGLFSTAVYMVYRTPAALKATAVHFDAKAKSESSTGPASSLGSAASAPVRAPYIVARRDNPLTYYDSLGRVFSFEPKRGQRLIDSVNQTPNGVSLEFRGSVLAVLENQTN